MSGKLYSGRGFTINWPLIKNMQKNINGMKPKLISEMYSLFDVVDAPALTVGAIPFPDFFGFLVRFHNGLEFGGFDQLSPGADIRLSAFEIFGFSFVTCFFRENSNFSLLAE